MKTYSIALIPGDGIGKDVTEAAWQVLQAAAKRGGFTLDGTSFPWSCAYYLETGAMMPPDGIDMLRKFDAIYLGAVGWPAEVPDSISLHGLLLPIRKGFTQYANIRPHRLLPGVQGPLRSEGFDILYIRENTEGEYSGAGGRVHSGTANEVAVETADLHACRCRTDPSFRSRTGAGAPQEARICDEIQCAEAFHGFLG